ncbi:TRAP transporter substrate-binding protein [Rhodoferax ferrireducens]|uniref:TRAP transporter substrate-binding protein n=1 Tax=Rhodoferax ferrireducens TaxID=192843 RepID=UPI003BB5CBC1
MNRHLFSRRRVVGALSAAGAIAALTPASVQAQEATIRIVYNTLKTHPIGQFFETLAQEIEKNTATTSVRLKTRTFPNGQLFADMQIPDAVSTGTIEIGQVTLALANSPDAVASQIGMLPLLWNSWEALWYAEDHDDAWRSVFQALLNKLGMQLLGFTPFGVFEFYANRPVKLPANFKGLRLRGVGVELSNFIRELGASPVTMSAHEMYQATQRGTIDGFITGPSSVYDKKLYEVVKYSTAASFLFGTNPAAANLQWWSGLPKDVQAAITKAAVVAQQKARAQVKAVDQHAIEQIAKLGVTIQTLTPAEHELWVKAAKPVHDKYLNRAGNDGRKLLAIAQEANAKFPVR